MSYNVRHNGFHPSVCTPSGSGYPPWSLKQGWLDYRAFVSFCSVGKNQKIELRIKKKVN